MWFGSTHIRSKRSANLPAAKRALVRHSAANEVAKDMVGAYVNRYNSTSTVNGVVSEEEQENAIFDIYNILKDSFRISLL